MWFMVMLSLVHPPSLLPLTVATLTPTMKLHHLHCHPYPHISSPLASSYHLAHLCIYTSASDTTQGDYIVVESLRWYPDKDHKNYVEQNGISPFLSKLNLAYGFAGSTGWIWECIGLLWKLFFNFFFGLSKPHPLR